MLARFMGEEKCAALNREAIQKMPIVLGLSLLCLPAFFLMAWGLLILVLFPDSSTGWGFDITMGIMLFALGLLILYPNSILFRATLAEHEALTARSNHAMQPTAGRSDDMLPFVKTFPLQVTRGAAGGG
jgi:hypothetical protein